MVCNEVCWYWQACNSLLTYHTHTHTYTHNVIVKENLEKKQLISQWHFVVDWAPNIKNQSIILSRYYRSHPPLLHACFILLFSLLQSAFLIHEHPVCVTVSIGCGAFLTVRLQIVLLGVIPLLETSGMYSTDSRKWLCKAENNSSRELCVFLFTFASH